MKIQTMATTFSLQLTDWNSSKTPLKTIRDQVFIQEQGVPVELEWDDLDETARHILAKVVMEDKKLVIGTARIIIKNKQAHIGRMAVLPAWRSLGVGAKILNRCIEYCYQQQLEKIVLNAQVSVLPFYQKAGFKICSEEFTEAGIPHKKMILIL